MQKKTNILLITSDQQHWNTIGKFNPEIKTPNLDRLCNEGTCFQNFFTVNPTCTPTRASLITGTYPSQHGAYSLGTKLFENKTLVGDVFIQNGYKTALVGKGHFQPLKETEEYASIESIEYFLKQDFWKKFHGPFYGFEHIELARGHTDEQWIGQHYLLWLIENGCDNWKDYFKGPAGNKMPSEGKWEIPEKYHYNNWIAEKTNGLLEEYKKNDDTFYLWASFFDPHPPYLVPEPFDTMYDSENLTVPDITPNEHAKNPKHFQMTQEKSPDYSAYKEPEGNGMHGCHSHLKDKKTKADNMATYYGMISLLDKYIGKILDKLDALGMAEDTLVVFTTDHGHFFGQHGLIAKGPFHYDDVIKIPAIARLPGKIPANKISNNLMSIVDLAPTFLSAAQIKPPRCMTGLNLLPEWQNEIKKTRNHVIVENRHQPTTLHIKTYINERFKFTTYWGQDYGELFDRINDPNEINNLWDNSDYQNEKNNLFKELLFAEMIKEPLPMPRVFGA